MSRFHIKTSAESCWHSQHCLFQTMICIIAIFLNMTIVSVLPRWKGLTNNTKILIANLTVSDILGPLFMVIRNSLIVWQGSLEKVTCLYMSALCVSYAFVDFGFVCIISAVYLIALKWPTYVINPGKICVVCVGNWLFCWLFFMTGIWTGDHAGEKTQITTCAFGGSFFNPVFMKICFFLMVLFLFFIMQLIMLLAIRKHRHQTANSVVPFVPYPIAQLTSSSGISAGSSAGSHSINSMAPVVPDSHDQLCSIGTSAASSAGSHNLSPRLRGVSKSMHLWVKCFNSLLR